MTVKFSAIGITVADMGKALAFYRRLGLDIPAEADAAPHAEVTVGTTRLMWDTVEVIHSFDPGWTAPQGGHRTALAFECADPAEVDRTYAELKAAGYEGHKAPWDADWGYRYAVVKDPDGNGVDLFAALPTP
jgi:catechol 2,3-dioxygenase-like lactoylglutathione lyase family enzyme